MAWRNGIEYVYVAYDSEGVVIDMDDRQVRLAERLGITEGTIAHEISKYSKRFAKVEVLNEEG